MYMNDSAFFPCDQLYTYFIYIGAVILNRRLVRIDRSVANYFWTDVTINIWWIGGRAKKHFFLI